MAVFLLQNHAPRVSRSRARAVEDAPSIFCPRSANPLEHVSLSRIGSITRPSHGLLDLQHHDVLATGYLPHTCLFLFYSTICSYVLFFFFFTPPPNKLHFPVSL